MIESCITAYVFSVIALRKPNPKPFFVLPETLTAFKILTLEACSKIFSFSNSSSISPDAEPPMRLEKNTSPLLNSSTPSVKKDLFSSKVCSKGPKFNRTSSKAVCPKSGTKVRSKVKLSEIPYFKSNPAVKLVAVSSLKVETTPWAKG